MHAGETETKKSVPLQLVSGPTPGRLHPDLLQLCHQLAPSLLRRPGLHYLLTPGSPTIGKPIKKKLNKLDISCQLAQPSSTQHIYSKAL
jgi:hypothetical protein